MQAVGLISPSRLPVGCGLLLSMVAAMSVPHPVAGAPVWCAPFETDNGKAVTHEQVASVIDNRVGAAGAAAGSASNLSPLLYVQYGVALPGVPALLDPAGAAGAFGISTPDDRRTGINTNLRSDAGNLATALTYEGYFYSPSATAIISPTFVGRRLVTQGRSATDGESRLAIGLHAKLVGVVDGLFDYEGFDYSGTATHGLSGGTGWGGAWDDTNNNFNHLTNDGVSLASAAFPFSVIGARLSGTGGEAIRPLSRAVDLSQEGGVLYISGLMRKTSTTATSADNVEFAFTAGTATLISRMGMTSDDKFFLNGTGTTTGSVVAGTTYFLIGKIISHAATPDEFYLSIYSPADTVPAIEPASWMLSNLTASSSVISHLRLIIGANCNKGEMDEIRVGSTYQAVTDPNAPMGSAGSLQNLLSVFYAEPGATPGAIINHLEFGTTPIQTNTWYHFAMTQDAAELRWYLNGQQEGQVLNPSIVPPGTSKISIANNRTGGTTDRGFYGALDEVRLWDKVLSASELTVNGGAPGSGLLWRSRFETSLGVAVTNAQPADTVNSIDNTAGARGSPAGIVAAQYVQYGQGGTVAPSAAIDPAALGGSFAISLPDLAAASISTPVASNSGNLANAVTMQGYFNTRTTTPITTNAVGSRLVTQMRSAAEGNARLAIGITGNDDAAPTTNVLAVAYFSVSANAVLVARGATAIGANTWYHFAVVHDGTDLRFYLNGVQEGEVLGVDLAAPGAGNIVVANDRTAGGARSFKGLLDKIVVSDHVIASTDFLNAGLDACLGKYCNLPFADMDNDDDVDQDDFGAFQLCFGLGILVEGNPCLCLDRDENQMIDANDLSKFTNCVAGPSIHWSLALTPSCEP